MGEQLYVDIVRRGYDAFGRWDLTTLLSLIDESIEWVTPGPPELPTAGRRHGRKGVVEFFRTLNELVEIDRFEAKEFIAQGDRVIVLGVSTSLVRSTGRIVEFEWAHAFTLKNGRIVSFHEYSDMVAIAAEVRAAQAKIP